LKEGTVLYERHVGGQHPTGERQNGPVQLTFNGSLRVDFQGSRVTSDGVLILVREFDERLVFSDLIVQIRVTIEFIGGQMNFIDRAESP
jgi:hypothetical protein